MSGTDDTSSYSAAPGGGDPRDPGGPTGPDGPGGPYDTDLVHPRDRRRLIIVGIVIAVLLALLVIAVVARNDDEDDVATDDTSTTLTSTTTTTSEGTSSTSDSTTTETTDGTTTPSTGGLTDEEAATVVWPDPGGTGLYTDPADAAQGFAEDLAGFTAPVLGEFQQGDSRSGEVEVRAIETGPVTNVAVRQMSDDNWYVIAAMTEQIEVTSPAAGSAIDHPLLVEGRAQAFEGTVQVAVYARGETEPLGEGFVTGSGSEMGPFSGEIEWENPGGGWGLVLFVAEGGEDGSTWQAAALPVGFIGGD